MAKPASSLRPRKVLEKMAQNIGCHLSSIGDIERLAGINTNSVAERKALWDRFRDLYSGPSQALIDAVMDHCSVIALKRIKAGEISLVPAPH